MPSRPATRGKKELGEPKFYGAGVTQELRADDRQTRLPRASLGTVAEQCIKVKRFSLAFQQLLADSRVS